MSDFDAVVHAATNHHEAAANHNHDKPTAAPETAVGEEGSAKRNITRKHGKRHSGKRDKSIDDGSTYEDAEFFDEHDPNYDSEAETGNEKYVSVGSPDRNGYSSKEAREAGQSAMTLTQFKRRIQPIIEQYFLNADVDELRRSVLELRTTQFSYEFVKRAITMSMDRGDREREFVSRMISDCFPDVFSTNSVGKGFERIFELIDELEKDAPAARDITAAFIARCVVDEVLPPAFLSDPVVCSLGGDIVEKAKRMLSREHVGARLERVWGPGDGRLASEMKVAVDQLLQEYVLSHDIEEAVRCVVQLNAPYFAHEIVKRAICRVVDKSEADQRVMHEFLLHLSRSDIVSRSQLLKGFNLVDNRMRDISLDTPKADSIFRRFVEWAKQDGILDASFEVTAV